MKQGWIRQIVWFSGSMLLLNSHALSAEEPTPRAVALFNSYSEGVESRLERQHQSAENFLATPASDFSRAEKRLRGGEVIIEKLTPPTGTESDGAMLHHWRGTAFAPGATAADFTRLLRNFGSYPQNFSPEVVRAKVLSQSGDQMQASMRIRQRHVITVVLDATYDITFAELDARHGASISRSRHISEVDAAGTRAERTLDATEEHGFLWRMNTYWSYEERDGGLYLQIESVSLTRSVPTGLGWAVRPYVASIPRESLEFTLRSSCNALRKQQASRIQPGK
jgi:hypothetical protein